MLTQLEVKIVHWLCSLLSSKFMVIPAFTWKDLKLSVRPNGRLTGNWIVNIIIIIEFYLGTRQVAVLIKAKDINAVILQGIIITKIFCHLALRLNIMSFKTEMARLLNQTLDIDNGWGKVI